MKKIAVIQSQALVSNTNPEKKITAGGTQRYAVQLAKLLQSEGYHVYLIGRSNRSFKFEYEGNEVIIFGTSNGIRGNIAYSKFVYDFCLKNRPNFTCYIDLLVGRYYNYPGSLSIDHGIGWDGPKSLKSRIKRYIYTRTYISVCRKYKKIVCVDTNFINWMRQYDKHFFSYPAKFYYVPNFADEELFPYNKRTYKKGDEYLLLYPRRLVEYRGYKLFIDMCEILKNKGYNIKPVMAFEKSGSDDYQHLFENKCCKYEIVHPTLNEITKMYADAYLTFVPTLWSEGTSLSAIEAICCGCPVITSNVGGLGNIVIPNFDGDIVSPTVEAFVNATEKALQNPDIRNRWADNCFVARNSFSTNNWKQKMKDVISQFEK